MRRTHSKELTDLAAHPSGQDHLTSHDVGVEEVRSTKTRHLCDTDTNTGHSGLRNGCKAHIASIVGSRQYRDSFGAGSDSGWRHHGSYPCI